MRPFRVAGLILGFLAFVLAGFLVVGILLPSGWETERSVHIEAPPEVVYPYLAHAEQWTRWTPSPETGVELFGPDEGVGSGRLWDDPVYGEGVFVISAVEPPHRVVYDVAVEQGAIRIQGFMQLEAVPEGTELHWREDGDFGWNPLLGYLAARMDALQGEQLQESLQNLKRLVEEEAATAGPD